MPAVPISPLTTSTNIVNGCVDIMQWWFLYEYGLVCVHVPFPRTFQRNSACKPYPNRREHGGVQRQRRHWCPVLTSNIANGCVDVVCCWCLRSVALLMAGTIADNTTIAAVFGVTKANFSNGIVEYWWKPLMAPTCITIIFFFVALNAIGD